MAGSSTEYGNDQHAHMLGAGWAWFKGRYPEDWETLRALPLDQGMERMLEKLRERPAVD